MVKIIRQRQVISGSYYQLHFDWLDDNGKPTNGGFSFLCDKDGNVIMEELQKPERACALENYKLCIAGQMRDNNGHTVGRPYVQEYTYRYVEPAAAQCEKCGGEATMDGYCGAWVCGECGHHDGLARCYCGWSLTGGDGRAELIADGETIDDDY